jgi:nitrate/TMAO reductase-like tetraheme cytochrome c subunit
MPAAERVPAPREAILDEQKTPRQQGFVARTWDFIRRPSTTLSVGALIVIGGLFGVLFWGGFNWAMELANTETFCISCHEMRDNPYEDLKKTIHFANRSGVRATCPDCHVPKEWIHKVVAKIEASTDLVHKIVGSVDTQEKFAAKKAVLAERVWASMKATDSRECRNCHSIESMDPKKQSPAAQVMAEAMKNGLTCIDCHRGIAHTLPK